MGSTGKTPYTPNLLFFNVNTEVMKGYIFFDLSGDYCLIQLYNSINGTNIMTNKIPSIITLCFVISHNNKPAHLLVSEDKLDTQKYQHNYNSNMNKNNCNMVCPRLLTAKIYYLNPVLY